ncbi:MAG: DUF4271 domain-containing protein [Bacteroidetes bacterium]|nr:DUF4271 domain-containing protein [Bacteroidota bacterium]
MQQQDTINSDSSIQAAPVVKKSISVDSTKPAPAKVIVAAVDTDTSVTVIAPIATTVKDTLVTTSYEQLITSHHLQSKSFYTRTRKEPTPDWYTITLLLIVFFITIVKVYYAKIFDHLIKAFYNTTAANQVVREENFLAQRAAVVLNIISYLVLALFLYRVAEYYDYKPSWMGKGFIKFSFIAVMVGCAYSVKMFFVKTLGILFGIDRPVSAYIFNLFLVNIILGLLLLPLLICISYVNYNYIHYFLSAAVVAAIGMFIYRTVKAIMIWLGQPDFRLYYLILYLCALEIAPLLIIAKLAAII